MRGRGRERGRNEERRRGGNKDIRTAGSELTRGQRRDAREGREERSSLYERIERSCPLSLSPFAPSVSLSLARVSPATPSP
eukprot:scaffold76652_cov31-Tisochrysis_lutea.AAC.1